MNSQDFENQLRGQPLRQLPTDWRKDILAAAARQQPKASPAEHESSSSWWRTLFWPAPQAWAGLAAVWILIWALQDSSGGSPGAAQITQGPRQVEYAMQEKQRLVEELLKEGNLSPTAPPKEPDVPQPRSEASANIVST